jgi:hypothetical protein
MHGCNINVSMQHKGEIKTFDIGNACNASKLQASPQTQVTFWIKLSTFVMSNDYANGGLLIKHYRLINEANYLLLSFLSSSRCLSNTTKKKSHLYCVVEEFKVHNLSRRILFLFISDSSVECLHFHFKK